MKKFGVIPVLIASLLATQALAGTLTVSGSLTVTTNLTAQSITLGGVTETNWTGVGSLPPTAGLPTSPMTRFWSAC